MGMAAGFTVGSRVVLSGSPWPERVGCLATVVAPPTDGTYPQPARGEVLVLLDDDPLNATHDGWTCVMRVSGLTLSASQEGTNAS